MEGCRVLDDSRTTSVPSKDEMVSCTSHVIGSIWAPNSSPSFHGSASMVNFEEFRVDKNNKHTEGKVENSNDEFDGSFHQLEKKRRLKPDQVHFLEKSFDVENKLEPDRKIQLAKEVGLQPRQVAIWFQNRRARYKTKVLEKEFDSLKANYDKLRADYDTLFTQNEKLKDEVNLLRQKLLVRENGKPKKEQCDPVSPLDFQAKTPFLCGDDAATSADSSVLEPADSSHVFETDVSDFSQDDRLSMSLLLHQQQSACLPKIEVEECYDDLQPNSCNLGFPVQDQGTWLWQY